jgi:lysophospholipase L1-like esterase
MIQGVYRFTLFTALALLLVVSTACGDGARGAPDSGTGGPGADASVDAGVSADAALDAPPDAAPDAPPDAPPDAVPETPPDAPPDAPPDDHGVVVTMSNATLTFPTPDLPLALTATVTGSAVTAVTWSSSNTYIATVSASGVVTSVSGGQAIITATSVADPSKTATSTATVAEPDRPVTTDAVDITKITGPIKILMAGDSLMRTYVPNADDQAGWGQVLDQFLTSDATVDNTVSDGGRSTRSFYNEVNRWDRIKAKLTAARADGLTTFVFIMFGHNDEKKTTDTDGPDFLTFASHNQNGTVAGTYYDYLERYIVETRALGGIPILFTPFVREELTGSPATVTGVGQHVITVPYAGETTARGDYPAAMRAIAAHQNVPLIDITQWSKAMVEARAPAGTLDYVYIPSDHTHVRELGALLIAQEAVRELNGLEILKNYTRPSPAPRLMIDASSLAFGSIFAGATIDRSFRISPFGDVSGTIIITAPTIPAPAGYMVSTDGITFGATATINCDSFYTGSKVFVRFTPIDAISYNGALNVAHSSLTLDYGNTAPSLTPGDIALTGNGRAATTGAPAIATWPMFSGTAIALDATPEGAIGPSSATLTGLMNKNVANGGARFDIIGSTWPAEGARAADRYVEFAASVTTGTFTLGSISLSAGSGGGSNMRWDIVYSTDPDFGSPTELQTGLGGAKDTLVESSFSSLGVNITAGQTLRLRVYPYDTTTTTGKSLMLANVVISGVTN